ncbi:hypothetical protein, partial [Thomasclavelia cocleata]
MSRKGRYYGRGRNRYYRSYYGVKYSGQRSGLAEIGVAYVILKIVIVAIPIALAYYLFKTIMLFFIPILLIGIFLLMRNFDLRTITTVEVFSSLHKFILILDNMLHKNVLSIVLTISSFLYVVYGYKKLINTLFSYYLEMNAVYVMKLIMLFDYSYIDFELIKTFVFHIVYILIFLFLTFLFLVSILILGRQILCFFSIGKTLLEYFAKP